MWKMGKTVVLFFASIFQASDSEKQLTRILARSFLWAGYSMNQKVLIFLIAFILPGMLVSCGHGRHMTCSVGTDSVNALMEGWTATNPNVPRNYFHEGRGNHLGADVLMNGPCEIVILDRPLGEKEVQSIESKTSATLSHLTLAKESLVILASPDLKNLTLSPDQLRDLFSGKQSGTYQLFAIESGLNEGTWFQKEFLGKPYGSGVKQLSGSGFVLEALKKTPGSLGVIRMGTAGMEGLPVLLSGSLFQMEGTGTKPLERTIHLYVKPGSPSTETELLLHGIHSPAFNSLLPHYGFQLP